MRYVYSLIRYCPRPGNGEYVNVGAIVGSDETADWEIRNVSNPARARQLGQHGPSLAAVFGAMAQFGQDLEDHRLAADFSLPDTTGISESWLWEQHHRCQNVLQFSEPFPLKAESAQEGLDMIFEDLVLDGPDTASARATGYRNKATAKSALRSAFSHVGVPAASIRESLDLEARLVSGSVACPIDFLVFNGKAVQVTQAVSFQLPNQEALARDLRSWTLGVAALRNARDNAVAIVGGRSIQVPSLVDVEVLYIAPSPDASTSVMSQALSYFELYDIHARSLHEAGIVASAAAELLSSAGVALDKVQ